MPTWQSVTPNETINANLNARAIEPGEAGGLGQLPAKQARTARRGIPADFIRRAETSDWSRGPKDVI